MPHKTLMKEIASLKKQVIKRQLLIVQKAEQLRQCCPHENQEELKDYCGGGYYDTAYTDYKIRCADCGTTIKEWRVDHGTFG